MAMVFGFRYGLAAAALVLLAGASLLADEAKIVNARVYGLKLGAVF